MNASVRMVIVSAAFMTRLTATPAAAVESSADQGADRSQNAECGVLGCACRSLACIVRPVEEWAGSPSSRYTLLANLTLGIGTGIIENTGHPRGTPVFGAGSFDRFFRDALRSRSKTDNFLNGDLGAMIYPMVGTVLFTSAGELTGTTHEAITRAVPFFWLGIGGNAFSTSVAKRSFGRERPCLKFPDTQVSPADCNGDAARESFYSGHTSTAFYSFAFVDPLLADYVRREFPDYRLAAQGWTGPALRILQWGALFAAASGVGYSRIEIDKHYMTDLLVGALFGWMYGIFNYHCGYRGMCGGPGPGSPVPEVHAMSGAVGAIADWHF